MHKINYVCIIVQPYVFYRKGVFSKGEVARFFSLKVAEIDNKKTHTPLATKSASAMYDKFQPEFIGSIPYPLRGDREVKVRPCISSSSTKFISKQKTHNAEIQYSTWSQNK